VPALFCTFAAQKTELSEAPPSAIGEYNIAFTNVYERVDIRNEPLLASISLWGSRVQFRTRENGFGTHMTQDQLAFKGRVVLITGAAQGLGKATAEAFAARGAVVALVDMNEGLLDKTADELRKSGIQCVSLPADITAPGAATRIVQRTVEQLGRLDILVNNAAASSVEALLDVTEKEWDKIFAVNVKALFFLLQAAAHHMKDFGGGRIINVSSPGTRMTLSNYTSYATSKAAVDYITRTAAANLGVHGITVNAVAPGRMDTPMQRVTEESNAAAAGVDLKTWVQSRTVDIPLRRRTTPEEVAEGIVWMATQAASYVTGNRLNISGGLELA
jgi:NAD(P)-dependent dehydrogenase (short-subunit alcohol dehydrogenase family)